MNNRLPCLIFTLCFAGQFFAQTTDSVQLAKEYTRLDEALKEPEKVYRLNLGNQSFASFPDSILKLTNLRYLSFRNDHLKLIPKEIGALRNLRVLDLSGNDFTTLPEEFTQLVHLEELYLDDAPNLDLEQDLKILGKLPNLKYLHLNNDGIASLPRSIISLKNLEGLYLNGNQLHRAPIELRELKKLNYIEIQNNPLSLERINELQNQGLKVKW
jgi:Leucine-rich repeat (LRR) protein